MTETVTLDELLELCEVAEQVRAEEISPDNLLLGAFWDPDNADAAIDAIKGHARECDEPRHTQLLQLASYMVFARALGQLQRKRLLAVYPPAEAPYGYRTWLQRALDAACMMGGEASPLFPLAEELTRKMSERDDPHDLWRLLHEDDDLGGTGVA